MGKLRDLLLMDEGPERDKLAKELNAKISKPNYKNKVPDSFKDEIKPKRIPAHPLEKNKSEAEITAEHEWFFTRKNILYFHTKVKGEIHSIGNGRAILKKNQNAGFFDMILLVQGKIFVGLELKAGKGGIWSVDQMRMHDLVIKAGGYALVSNSIHTTEAYLKEKGLL